VAIDTKPSDEGGQTVWQWNRDAFGQGKVDRDVDGDGNNTTIVIAFRGNIRTEKAGYSITTSATMTRS